MDCRHICSQIPNVNVWLNGFSLQHNLIVSNIYVFYYNLQNVTFYYHQLSLYELTLKVTMLCQKYRKLMPSSVNLCDLYFFLQFDKVE